MAASVFAYAGPVINPLPEFPYVPRGLSVWRDKSLRVEELMHFTRSARMRAIRTVPALAPDCS